MIVATGTLANGNRIQSVDDNKNLLNQDNSLEGCQKVAGGQRPPETI